MPRPLAPHGGNDRVYTPDDLALRIVAHFNPTGRCLEPCRGREDGGFIAAMPGCAWAELDAGRDFLTYDFGQHFDWVVTNPPWSQIRAFLARSMALSDHVVFLCLVNAFFMRARLRDMQAAGFGFKEILFLDTPPTPWPQTGFQLGATHIVRGWGGDCRFSRL